MVNVRQIRQPNKEKENNLVKSKKNEESESIAISRIVVISNIKYKLFIKVDENVMHVFLLDIEITLEPSRWQGLYEVRQSDVVLESVGRVTLIIMQVNAFPVAGLTVELNGFDDNVDVLHLTHNTHLHSIINYSKIFLFALGYSLLVELHY